MNKKTIISFQDYIKHIESLIDLAYPIMLYRGQSGQYPLLPSIARQNPLKDTANIEKAMLIEFKRRTQLLVSTTFRDYWDLLVYAQHFGMKTRLLDWTSNPLTALWFACSNENKINEDSYVYVFAADKSLLIKRTIEKTPFNQTTTKILKPALNNERIIAQAGWFTSHKFSAKAKCFVKLERNQDLNHLIVEIRIPSNLKIYILKRLNIFGFNSQTLFPDVTGICNQLNWEYAPSIM